MRVVRCTWCRTLPEPMVCAEDRKSLRDAPIPWQDLPILSAGLQLSVGVHGDPGGPALWPSQCKWDRERNMDTKPGYFQRTDDVDGGGDCVCVLDGHGGRLLVFVADVAGHDAGARSFAADLRRRVLDRGRHLLPGCLLASLNADLEASWPPEMFACAVCLSFTPLTGEVIVSVAGQLPPLLKRRSSCSFVRLPAGPALGVFAEHQYVERRMVLAPGEMLVAVTDGVTDPLATADDPLGMNRLAAIIASLPDEPTAIPDRLLLRIHRCAQFDDASVLTLAMPTVPFDVFLGCGSRPAGGQVAPHAAPKPGASVAKLARLRWAAMPWATRARTPRAHRGPS